MNNCIKSTSSEPDTMQIFAIIYSFFPLISIYSFSSHSLDNTWLKTQICFSWSVMSNSLQPHGLQVAMIPWPSPSPEDCSNSCPLSQWCHLNHLIPCCPLLLLPSIFLSIRVFSSKSESWENNLSPQWFPSLPLTCHCWELITRLDQDVALYRAVTFHNEG